MSRHTRLRVLNRQVAWHARFALSIVEDLEEAAQDRDAAAACFLAGAFVASALTLSYDLWPRGRRLTDQVASHSADELRQRLGIPEASLLAPERLLPYGAAIRFTQRDCLHNLDLRRLTITLDGQTLPLEPLFVAVHDLLQRCSATGDVPADR
jgi:hypothetical protein